jgi:hypothetical protein
MDRMNSSTRLLMSSVITLAAVTTACASSDDGSSEAGALVTTAGPDGGTPTGDLPVDVDDVESPIGTCTIVATGDVETTVTATGTASSDFWLPAGVTSPTEPIPLIVSCDTSDGSSIGFSSVDDEVSFAPGTYELPPLNVGVFTPEAILTLTEPAELIVDAFDATRVAGRISFTAGVSGDSSAAYTVEFDLPNPLA